MIIKLKISTFTSILSLLGVILLNSCNYYDNPVGIDPSLIEIKSITKWKSDPATQARLYQQSYKEYDENGNLIVWTKFDDNGMIVKKSVYSYSGQNSTEQVSYYDKTGNIDSVNIINYSFNSSGDIIERCVFSHQGDLLSKENFDYDNRGNVTRKIESGIPGSSNIETNYHYSYNDMGNVVEKITNQQPDGSYQKRDSLNYQIESNIVQVISFGSLGEVIEIKQLEYNQYGRVSKETIRNSDGKIVELYIYEYEYYNI